MIRDETPTLEIPRETMWQAVEAARRERELAEGTVEVPLVEES